MTDFCFDLRQRLISERGTKERHNLFSERPAFVKNIDFEWVKPIFLNDVGCSVSDRKS